MVRPERRRALVEAIDDLERYQSAWSLDAFLASRDAQRMVQQALYVAAQACVDEALDRCRSEGIEGGTTYREAMLALAQAGLLDADLAGRMADWASFRNVLAHFYPVVDLRRVHAALQDIADLRAFAAWLEKS